MLTFLKRRRARPASLLNERGQGLAFLLVVLAGLFLLVLCARGAG